MCFGSSVNHIRMNLTVPHNHRKRVAELTVRQKKETDSELTTQKVESYIGSKSKMKFFVCFFFFLIIFPHRQTEKECF